MPSSNSSLRARSNAESLAERSRTARADAIPKLSLYSRPLRRPERVARATRRSRRTTIRSSRSRRPRPAPAPRPSGAGPRRRPTRARRAAGPRRRTPARRRTAAARPRSSSGWCTSHPGPTPTLTMSAPADDQVVDARPRSPRCPPPPAPTGTGARTACSAPIIFSWCPCAVSTTSTSDPGVEQQLGLGRDVAVDPDGRRRPAAGPRRRRRAEYSVARSAPVLVMMPTQRPAPSTTGASRCRPSCSSANARSGGVPAGSVNGSADITWLSWVNRSTPRQSASVTTPTGLFVGQHDHGAVRPLRQQAERVARRVGRRQRQRGLVPPGRVTSPR